MARLETIHSATEPSAYYTQKSISTIGRQPSRAERSAAKNIKDAKKRGWRQSIGGSGEKKLKKDRDGASSAGWTDVSEGAPGRKEKNGGKCVVM
jgi:hypothetical protein